MLFHLILELNTIIVYHHLILNSLQNAPETYYFS